jgi:hypothetical protein
MHDYRSWVAHHYECAGVHCVLRVGCACASSTGQLNRRFCPAVHSVWLLAEVGLVVWHWCSRSAAGARHTAAGVCCSVTSSCQIAWPICNNACSGGSRSLVACCASQFVCMWLYGVDDGLELTKFSAIVLCRPFGGFKTVSWVCSTVVSLTTR